MNPDVIDAIRKRAKELADTAPPLSAEQSHLLVSLFRRYTETTKRAGVA